MKHKPFTTATQPFHRLGETGLQRITLSTTHSPSTLGWALGLLLLCGASFTGAWAQIFEANPNRIGGTISWNNNPLSAVGQYLDSAAHGLAGGNIGAVGVSGTVTFSASKPVIGNTSTHLSETYEINVQAGNPLINIPPIQHNVSPQMFTGDGFTYWFETKLSGGVISPPLNTVVPLDFAECAGLVDLQFCDPAGNPVTVNTGDMYAYLQSGSQQAVGSFANVSGVRLAVRSGTPLNLLVIIYMTSGTDPFVDLFSITHSTTHQINVPCDDIKYIKITVPPRPPQPGSVSDPNLVNKVIGIANVLREEEHWIDRYRSILNISRGPYDNYRYANIVPACALGVSPFVGTPTCNSAGPYELINVLKSDYSTPSRNYSVQAGFVFGLNRRYEFFASPVLPNETVPSLQQHGGPLDLGNIFVIDPGYVKGDVFLCGPDEGNEANSLLRFIYRDSDVDSNSDLIPDAIDLNASSLHASGLPYLGSGATHTAAGGFARVLFEGDFVAAGVDKNNFVGDYKMTLGGLGQGASRWNQQTLRLRFSHLATTDPDSYIDSLIDIVNAAFADVEVFPTQTIVNNHRYGMSQVCISFHTTSGILRSPLVVATGSFNGVNFENQPAQYTCDATGHGTPTGPGAANGQVVLCIPEGNYTFTPGVSLSSDGGSTYSYNILQSILNYPVPPCAKICITPEIQMTLTNLPHCATNRLLNVAGAVNSVANVASIYYELNTDPLMTICNNCGVSPSFNFNVTLADCQNTLKVTAIDVNGQTTSFQTTIHYDVTPPVLSGCTNITTSSLAGTNGNFVTYALPTALDNCDGPLPVTCVPPPGSFFANGPTAVTCTAVDRCHNTNTCQFTVTVKLECVAILDERFTATGTNGVDSYRFCVRNQSDHDLGYVTLVNLSPGVLATPYFIPLTPPVAPGQTACVTVTLSGVGARTNLCFRLMAHSPDFMQCCIIQHCVSLAASDLYVEDTPVNYLGTPDLGREPDVNMASQSMWVSRGIWVHQDCAQPPGTHLTHQNPYFGQQNCVFAEVKNRGTAPVAGAKLELYYANASLGLSWPAEWTLLGTVTLPTIAAGASHVAQASWLPPGTGHYCLIARIVSALDPMTVPETADINANVRANNNLAWRNVNVAECLHTPANKVEVRVHNTEPVPKLLTLIFTADQDFLANGGEAILSPGTPLFDRWVAAGAHGVNVLVTNGNEIRFTGSPARFEGIPFSEKEERIFNLTLRADEPMPVPGTNHVYHASLMQAIDGQIVGGVNYVIVTRALDTDTDGDGIPDVNDPDDDGDGIPDALDPKPTGESDCPPSALSINLLGGQLALTWSGLGYRLQASTDFSHWDELPAATSPATLPAGSPYRFFRLICR